jgi:hypothetical protein
MADSIVDKVEKFIQRIHDGTYKIDISAYKIITEGDNLTKIRTNLPETLAGAMQDYEVLKSVSPSPNQQAAASCLFWINRAFAYGVVREGESLIQKLGEKDKEISSEFCTSQENKCRHYQ